jgi:hypothetical protein
MTAWRRAVSRGYTRLEFALAVCVLGLLVAALASSLLVYREEAERVAAQQLIAAVRTGLAVRSAQLVAAGQAEHLAALADTNPMALLSEKPVNYVGEFYAPDISEIPKGQWFFDRTERTLVYLFSTPEKFSLRTSNFLKFKVKLLRLPNPADKEGRSKVITGVILDQVSDQAAIKIN